MAARPSGRLGGLETSECPHPVLVNEVAERIAAASEGQVRGRGSPRPAWSRIVTAVGAGEGVQSQARAQGYRPTCSAAVSAAAFQRYEPPLARLIPWASSEAAGSPTPLHSSWRNWSPSHAGSRVNIEYTARASLCARTVKALAMPALYACQVLLPRRLMAQEQHGGFGEGPVERRLAELLARGAVAFTGGFFGTLAEPAIGDARLDARAAVDGRELIEEPQGQALPHARERAQAGEGLGLVRLRW
jgi:hypothetical protein